MKVCLDARLDGSAYGGAGSAVLGLARGLSALPAGGDTYLFLTWAGDDAWLTPHVSGPCRLLAGPPAPREPAWKRRARERYPALRRLWHRVIPLAGSAAVPLPRSDGAAERAGADVLHFTYEGAFDTALPSLYQPWDLQHLHFPQYFTPRHFLLRERTYRHFCARARIVVVATGWAKRDLVVRYGLPPDKVRVIPPASVLPLLPEPGAGDLDAARRTLAFPEDFALYPAQTWPHKNHLGLFEALVLLRDQHGLRVPVVCPGPLREFHGVLRRRIGELGLAGQVRFPGFVGGRELRALYRLCRCLVFPTRFEGFGLPLLEAFDAGVPAAASAAPPVAALAGEAAVLFDPADPARIADAVGRVWTDRVLRDTLVRRGRARAARYSWERTARAFRACYRETVGRPPDPDDRAALAEAGAE